jgi:hypothetical protein
MVELKVVMAAELVVAVVAHKPEMVATFAEAIVEAMQVQPEQYL